MAHIGLIGIGVMGSAFALNLAEQGHTVSLLDRSVDKMQATVETGKVEKLCGGLIACADMDAFLKSVPSPRSILTLVPSGAPLDGLIATLKPLLDKGDLIADLGNSNYAETERRVTELESEGLEFIGMGISGGADGARHGPSIMAGGSKKSWARIKQPLQDVSAKYKDAPCCDWFGPGGAGHFIKMIHNGIEYADMQLIAEAYGLMSDGMGLSAAEIGHVFQTWTHGALNSYLMEIASEVALAKDPQTGQAMLDVILDKAGQKGTGRWSVIEALHLGAPSSIMAAAVEARNISADLDVRQKMQAAFGAAPKAIPDDILPKEETILALEQALIAGKICAYAQGFEVLSKASDAFDWDLDLAAIARVWRAGCIIRSVFLDEIADVFEADNTQYLVLADVFKGHMKDTTAALQAVTSYGISNGHPIPAFCAALNYHNARRTGRGTANMIQGLRDYFGAHTFERMDAPGQKVNGPWHD